MKSAARKVAVGFAALMSVALMAIAFAAAQSTDPQRRVVTVQDADYYGNDLSILRGVSLSACSAACLDDAMCRAFTYNQSAQWCFLKSDFGALTPAQGAVAGRVVPAAAVVPGAEAQRIAELTAFLDAGVIDAARRLAGDLGTLFPPGTRTYGSLLAAAVSAQNAGNADLAASLYGSALALAADDPAVWNAFSRMTLQSAGSGNSTTNRQRRARATAAAVSAYLRSGPQSARAEALIVLAQALTAEQAWRPAIKAYRASLELVPDPAVRETLDALVAEHGFRVVETSVEADAANPRICVVFSDPLATSRALADFVTVGVGDDAPSSETAGLAIEPETSQICIDGVRHGQRYTIRVRAGLPAADGETLARTIDLTAFVRDRAPWVGFAGNAYVLPAVAQPSIPVQSVNTDAIEAEIYRIGDRGLVSALQQGIFLSQLDQYVAQDIATRSGELIWSGEIAPATGQLNEMVTTAIPVTEALAAREPGVYVITARVADAPDDEYWMPDATQWFVISDLGIAALSGTDGVNVFIRSLTTAEPEAGVRLRLVARNNEVLGEAVTDADGHAVFGAGLARGTGGNTAEVVVAETADGDYAFLSLTRPAFDLTDRGVDGRRPAGAIDAYLTTERGVYRPGETVHATALLRDADAIAVSGLPLTVIIDRPDGVQHSRTVVEDGGLGGYAFDIPLRADAMRGSWQISIFTVPNTPPVAQRSFLVEDFEPDRLAFDLTTSATAFSTTGTIPLGISARYLYGAAAPELPVAGDIAISAVRTLAGYPGFVFGRHDDTFGRIVEPIDAATITDAEGAAVLDVGLPTLPRTTRPLTAQAVVRVTDTSGRAIERTLALPVAATGPHIGVRPQFDLSAGLGEGATAAFDVIAVGADGARIAMPRVTWNLVRIETSYQWYSAGGVWRWEAVERTTRIDSGTVDIAAGAPVTVSAPVEWGRYRLELTSTGANATSTSLEFHAGWYVANAGTDTPDLLSVALDQPAYRVGDTAHLRLDPQFAGLALVTVVDDGLIAMETVQVPAEGTTVDLPVTADWGPGAYVTATLYRPMDVAAGRMPARALGLAWAAVDPGARDLDVVIDLPETSAPRGPLTVPVTIANLAPGTEAYVVVTAVDVGILNLTNHQPPNPDGWYFGQRRLGVEIRDLYGSLIDTTQGQLGAIRSGGDGAVVRLGAPPSTQPLVAFTSGIVRVDETGRATVTFEMPDFNGTVRVMAEAWSQEGVGHAVRDVFVRDPVVVQTTTPRFLNLGDASRLLIEIDSVAGPAGDYRLTVEAGDEVRLGAGAGERTFTLAEGGRLSIAVPVTGVAIGNAVFRVVLTMPDGTELPKRFELGVRAPGADITRQTYVPIAAGGTLTLDAALLADFVPGTATLSVAAGGAARLDLPGVLARLWRYPYGCTEQLVSVAMPLLYVNEVAQAIGLQTDEELAARVRSAIEGVLANQAANGSFGLWGPYNGGDLWLDAYVTDFLTRARAEGYAVPALAMTLALDNLANALAYAPDFSNGGEDVAYAAYVLAANGRASLGDLRYYVETRLDSFATPLAKAQIGAAIALYGDRARAERAFRSAMNQLASSGAAGRSSRSDYGSVLRDSAAVLALAVEFSIAAVDPAALAGEIADMRSRRNWTSTQEDAWTVMAAAALTDRASAAGLAVDGMPVTGPVYRSWYDTDLAAAPVVIANTGAMPVDAVISITGTPVALPIEGGNGFAIARTYYLPDGTLADVASVTQNDRFVVTLTVTQTEARTGRLLITDPLPAGFEIENPDLSISGDVGRYPWLDAEGFVLHSEARTEAFVAAVNRYASSSLEFTVAYTVRAVSPGTFVHAGATVEDMYRPELRASTASGTVKVGGPVQ